MFMVHVYFHDLWFARFSMDFKYLGIKRIEIFYSKKELIEIVVYPSQRYFIK